MNVGNVRSAMIFEIVKIIKIVILIIDSSFDRGL